MNGNFRKQQQKTNRGGHTFLVLGICTLIVAVVLSVVLIYLLEHQPNVNPLPPFPTNTTGSVVPPETTETGTRPVDPNARKEGYYTFLVAGLDQISRSTDVLMLVSLDTTNEEIHIVQIPRDTYINKNVAGYVTVTRVNGIFAAEFNHQRQYYGASQTIATKMGMQALCDKLSTALCIHIDDYVLIDTAGFREVIDAFGGIDYNVPFDMKYSDPEQDLYIDLKAGYQHLNGAKCEQLIRNRDGYLMGDLDRVDLRGDFLIEAFRQIKSKITVGNMVALVPTLVKYVNTSMSVADMVAYTRMVYQMGMDHIAAHRIAGDTRDGSAHYYLDHEGALADVNAYLNVWQSDIPAALFDERGMFRE